MHGAILLLSQNMPSWRSAQFKEKAQGQLYPYFYLYFTLLYFYILPLCTLLLPKEMLQTEIG